MGQILQKINIIIGLIIFSTILLHYPLISSASQADNNISGEVNEVSVIAEEETQVEVIEEVEIIEEKSTEEKEDQEYPEDWEIVIIDEPLPVAIPSFIQVDINNPIEETIPLVTLPKTGGKNYALHSILGALMLLLGTYMNTNKQRQT